MKPKSAIVITGAPSSGKTTTIEGLRKHGYPVVDEISTIMLTSGWHPNKDGRHVYQREVLRRQLEEEARHLANGEELFFLDRGLLDGAAFYRMDKIEVPDMYDEHDLSHYAGVFLLEHLGKWVDNGVRFENLDFALQFEPVIESVYTEKGFPVIKVPVLSAEERVEFVLTETKKLLRKG